MAKNIIITLILIAFLIYSIFWIIPFLSQDNPSPNTPNIPKTSSSSEVVASNLDTPWSLDFLPDKSLIFTQRGGQVMLLKNNQKTPITILEVTDVVEIQESGRMGLVLHPNFSSNNFVYIYSTYSRLGIFQNKVSRYKLENDRLIDEKIILDNIPGAGIHDGGRLKFGPDGNLYITTGDAANSNIAQDLNSLGGKILRVKDGGAIPDDNPFPNSPVFSYGHRNSQGLAWDDKGGLWATEHGPSANDELNKINQGLNYGWPLIIGNESRNGLESPVLTSGQRNTWAPSGLSYFNGNLYFAGLRSQALYKVSNLNDLNNLTLSTYFQNQFGRLRDVVVGPDNMLYLLTSNRDGRGSPSADDDKIIKVNPSKLD